MEQTLDEISTGEAKCLPYLEKFYLGEMGLATQVKEREKAIDAASARTIELDDLGGAKVRIGQYGPYIEAENGSGPVKASLPKDLTPSDIHAELIETLLQQKTEGPDKVGLHPETGEPIYVLIGTYGPYVQLGDATEENKKPKRASLPKGVTIEDVTMDMAVGLLSLPRTLGIHPETNGKVQAGLGRFGPYVVHDQGKEGKEYRSLKATDDVLTIDIERAVELLAEPKKGRGGTRSKSKAPLRELGTHPADGEPVNIYDGPYGPYIKHGKTNASVPEGESVEGLTMEKAVEALAAKAGSTTKSSRKSTKSGTSAKKTTTGKTTAKKTTATTSTKKKS
jgi:DNA topoisomerase-1